MDLIPAEADIMCEIGDSLSCGRAEYFKNIDKLAKFEGMELLERLEKLYNHVPYARDPENFGEDDYWATPEEFLEANAGDCEEYAIIKYLTLKELGWSDDDMRIVVLWDSNMEEYHAVVLINYLGKEFLLDNATPNVVAEADGFPHYHVIEAVNETGSWSYRSGGYNPRMHMVSSRSHR